MISKIIENKSRVFFVLMVTIFIVYGNALFNDFVHDDNYLIVKNPYIKDFRHFKDILTSDVTVTSPYRSSSGYYRPLSMAYLMLAYKMWGLNPFGFHLQSILLHVLCAYLVFLIVQNIVTDKTVAFWSAFIFAIHPIHVEAVTGIFNVMGLLACTLGLTSFLLFVRSKAGQIKIPFAGSLFFYFLGVFTKEEVFLFPVIYILYDYFFIARFDSRILLKRWKAYCGFLLIAIFYLILRSLIIEKAAAWGFWDLNVFFNITPFQNPFLQFLMVLYTYGYYIYLLFFPIKLTVFYVIAPIKNFLYPQVILLIGVPVALLFYAVKNLRKSPVSTFFIALFFVGSAMIIGIIPIGGLFADRFMYFPSIAFCFFASSLFSALSNKNITIAKKPVHNIIAIAFAGILSFFAFQTVTRNYVWRNNLLLWQDAAEKGSAAFIHLNLGVAYQKKKLYHDAIGEYQEALNFSTPKRSLILNEIGKIYGILGEYDEALVELLKALTVNNRYVETYYNIGITYFHKQDFKNASVYLQKATVLDPSYPWSYYGQGLIYEKQGKTDKACAMFRKALQLKPELTPAQEALTNLERTKDR